MFCHFLPLLELILALGRQISHIYNGNCIFISGQCIFFPTCVKIIYYSCNMIKNQIKHRKECPIAVINHRKQIRKILLYYRIFC